MNEKKQEEYLRLGDYTEQEIEYTSKKGRERIGIENILAEIIKLRGETKWKI